MKKMKKMKKSRKKNGQKKWPKRGSKKTLH